MKKLFILLLALVSTLHVESQLYIAVGPDGYIIGNGQFLSNTSGGVYVANSNGFATNLNQRVINPVDGTGLQGQRLGSGILWQDRDGNSIFGFAPSGFSAYTNVVLSSGTRTLLHNSSYTAISNSATQTGTEFSGGLRQDFYSNAVTASFDKTNGILTLKGGTNSDWQVVLDGSTGSLALSNKTARTWLKYANQVLSMGSNAVQTLSFDATTSVDSLILGDAATRTATFRVNVNPGADYVSIVNGNGSVGSELDSRNSSSGVLRPFKIGSSTTSCGTNLVVTPGTLSVAGAVDATNTISARVSSSVTPAFRSTGTNNVILTSPDGGTFILRVDNTGLLTAVTNTSGL